MIPLAFFGGAFVGAAGLLAAALCEGDGAGSKSSSSLKDPDRFDEREVADLLAEYSLAATRLSMKCTQVEWESSDLHVASLSLDDDGLLQKMANIAEDGLTKAGRSLRCSQLKDLKAEASSLYGTYRGVFRQANALLRECGGETIDLRSIRFASSEVSVNNALDNDDWCLEFGAAVDNIRNFLDTSSAIAEQLITLLEGIDDHCPAASCLPNVLELPKAD